MVLVWWDCVYMCPSGCVNHGRVCHCQCGESNLFNTRNPLSNQALRVCTALWCSVLTQGEEVCGVGVCQYQLSHLLSSPQPKQPGAVA